MTSMYLLMNYESNIMSTYANQRNVIIGSRYRDQIEKIRNVLITHHFKYGRWINECVHYEKNEFSSILQMRTNECSKHIYNPLMRIHEIDFSQTDTSKYEHLFLFRHSDMLVTESWTYDKIHDILTIQGIYLHANDIFESNKDEQWCYLESCFEK